MHSAPPWPSNTAKRLISFHQLPPMSSSTISPSYIEGRQPISMPIPELNRFSQNIRLPILSWLCNESANCLPGSILLYTLQLGINRPLTSSAIGFLHEKIKSGSLLKQYGSHPTSIAKSVNGSLVKLILILLYTLFSIYHFFASPQTLINFSLSFSSKGQSLKLLYSAPSNCDKVRMPLYQSTSLRQLIWKHMQISSISLIGVEKVKQTTKGPIVKYSPSFTSTPYLGMFIHVPFSLPKSSTSKFLNPSNFN